METSTPPVQFRLATCVSQVASQNLLTSKTFSSVGFNHSGSKTNFTAVRQMNQVILVLDLVGLVISLLSIIGLLLLMRT